MLGDQHRCVPQIGLGSLYGAIEFDIPEAMRIFTSRRCVIQKGAECRVAVDTWQAAPNKTASSIN
jgi:hypothetical protein